MARAKGNYASKLGWSSDDRVLLVHTDDAGLLQCANRGALRGLEEGVARSFSVMMPCRGLEDIAAYLREHPGTDAGLHITLTSEWPDYRWRPMSDQAVREGLTSGDGCFWPSSTLLARHGTPEGVKVEIEAQLEGALAMGMPVTHLDCHMAAVFLRADFLHAYAEVGIDRGIPVMIARPETSLAARAVRMARKIACRVAGHGWYEFPQPPPGLVERVWAAGLPVIDAIHADSYGWPRAEKAKRMAAWLHTLPPGITAMLVHCTSPAEDAGVIQPALDTRLGDTEMVTSPLVIQTIREQGIHLVTWRELLARRQAC
jgi:predicted glycoside hydrolase/deacetylase ChbG (UPF0249 family)